MSIGLFSVHRNTSLISHFLCFLSQITDAAHAVGQAVVHEGALDAFLLPDPAAHLGQRVPVKAGDEGEAAVRAAALSHRFSVLAKHNAGKDERLETQHTAAIHAAEHAVQPLSCCRSRRYSLHNLFCRLHISAILFIICHL